MRKFFTLALAAFASLSMWAETTTLPTSNSGLTNGATKYEWSNTNSQVAGNVLYWATRGSISADETVGMRPYQLGIAIQVTAAVKLTFNVTSNTTSARTITGKVYTATEELFNVWKNATVGSSLESYVIGVNSKDAASMTPEETAIHANEVLGAITSQKDANKKVLIGETESDKVATVYGSAISHDCPTTKLEENSFDIELEAGKYLIYLTSSGGSVGVKTIDIVSSCTAPADPLKLKLDTTKSEASGLYVGDKITLTATGGNGGTTTLTLDGAAFSGNEWTAEAGEHTFVLSQDVKDGVCGAEVQVKLDVATKTAVESAVISGASSTFVNKTVTLTCTAANATDFQWFKGDDAISGATANEYEFTPDAVGEVTFYCEAWNQFTNPHKKSEGFKVTVTEGACGVLAHVSVTGKNAGKLEDGAIFSGTVSVAAEGTAEYGGYTGYKLKAQDSHVGITFTDGTLKEKDKVIVYVTKVSDGKKLQIFSDKGSTLIAETEDLQLGENVFVLDDRAEGKDGLYVYRVLGGTEGAQYNAYIAYVELKRPCGEESSDATLKSLKVGDDAISLEDDKFDYEYELAADFAEEQVTVSFELNDAKASADKTSPIQILTPEAGASQEVKINVTAEDGTKAIYTITISKAEAPKSDDATIKTLKINNEDITAKNDTFYYEVAATAELDSVEVSFVLADKATADPASGFKVLVPAADAAAVVKKITVTAEDGTTTKEYFVCITKAKAVDPDDPGDPGDEAIDNIGDGVQAVKFFENGQLVIIKNGIKYNAQGAILK